MNKRLPLFVTGIILGILVVVIVTATLIPQQTNPAFDAAVSFVNAAGSGDDAAAMALLSPELQAWVADNCPNGSVSACVEAYAPDSWGDFASGVFRRAAPDAGAWDVDVISYYALDQGSSGVCTYARVEQDSAGAWKVVRWAGWAWCGDPATRSMATNPDAPNQAP